MRREILTGTFCCVAVAIAIHCGGTTTTTNPPHTPKVHRSTAMMCPQMRAPSIEDGGVSDAGMMSPDSGLPQSCNQDSDCTQGKNGRCGYSRIGKTCSYDTCFQDGDCMTGAVCECRSSASSSAPNHCTGGNQMGACRVDADCGEKGFCSPTLGTCGNYSGIQGYFCHTSADECVDDTECTQMGAGYCMFDTMVKHWKCSYSHCAG